MDVMTNLKKYSNIQLKVKDLYAVEKAKIDIDAITLLSGINGSGKSTLSRLLFHVIHNVNNYDELTNKQLIISLSSIARYLYDLYRSITIRKNAYEELPQMKIIASIAGYFPYVHIDDIVPSEDDFHVLLHECVKFYKDNHNKPSESDINQLSKLLGKEVNADDSFISNLESLKDYISSIFEENSSIYKQRSAELIINELTEIFDSEEMPGKFSLKEWDDKIISYDNEEEGNRNNVKVLRTIKNVAYIDTPYLLNMQYQGNRRRFYTPQHHWDLLLNLLYDSTVQDETSIFTEQISNVIGGHVELRKKPNIYFGKEQMLFIPNGESGSVQMKGVATGIKSFLIIQRLLQIGLLNDSTLLIIDEPEAHLHPQWTVEYAKLIVDINKALGVKFLIASHSTDFIETLSAYGDKNDMLDSTNPLIRFYLAKETSANRFQFNDCHGDIEPIFNVFNKSYDKMNQFI